MIPSMLTKTSTTKSGKRVTYPAWWVSLILSMALSLGTWNPTGHHFLHYLANADNIFSGFKPFYILIMVALWLLAIKSIFQSLKLYGAIITAVIISAFVWGLQQYGLINIKDLEQLGWAATLGMGFLIWLGLNASIMWKNLTGVYTTDLTEEG